MAHIHKKEKCRKFKALQEISILQFFKTQDVMDKVMYDELFKIFNREKEVSSYSDPYFGLPLKKEQNRDETA
ncbi:hypothetical protein PIB30_035823 [Stylosanthes scabra]|uniref:Uncharacterized protein n=1 Tax=Stylosanthes scabra TaxID=79078 RepID=A0ABU6YDW3_9FABA|nr:hypothetical protein [Stylosanthes scabra]